MAPFLNTDDIAKYLIAIGILDAAGGHKGSPPVVKTADYTIVTGVDPSGTLFTNRGAGAPVIFTLPPPVPALAGVFYEFEGVADFNFTVSAGAGKAVTFNNAAAASLACVTAGMKIGAHIRAMCDGVSWLLNGDRIGVTYTVA